jgi:DNA-binding XRE family transcriptional regulator
MPKSIRMISAAVRFRRFRKAKRMSQGMLALCLGISQRAVQYIERGTYRPTLRHLNEFEALVERHKEN